MGDGRWVMGMGDGFDESNGDDGSDGFDGSDGKWG
jgi:hypothetical protein